MTKYCRNIIAVLQGDVVRCKHLPPEHSGLCIGTWHRGRVYDKMVHGDRPQPKMSDAQALVPGANKGIWEVQTFKEQP